MLDEQVYEHHAAFGITSREDRFWGVPYPGEFLLDERGIVSEKRFQKNSMMSGRGSFGRARLFRIRQVVASDFRDGHAAACSNRPDAPAGGQTWAVSAG